MVKVVAITGYKPFELGIFGQDHPGIKYIKLALKKQLIHLIEDGLEWVIISGQLGVELWAAEITFELQEEYPELRLAVITPFLEQEEKWNETNKEFYQLILSQADYVNSITNRKYDNPSQFRLKNAFFLDKSDALLIFYDEEKDGSPRYIYADAKKKSENEDYQLITINAYDLQAIVEEEQFANNDY
ncbi:DUF1273 domain-containing protein [Fredinandcohnia onubensis]|uniref:DUF1273 domain-containing protein n=1 Tax=Fredinandcohnia onubensis TaxID=1571209 RepID=UPI000C0BEDFB|nr:DUF1273 domain-containing protein [Fredinandcohnia onubensis]